MTLDDLLNEVSRSPLRDRRDWFQRWHRPAIAIHSSEAAARFGGSRLGGAPDLPPAVEWPRHEKGPYRFLAQIDLSELPSLETWGAPWQAALPRKGLLSLFVADDPTGEMDPEGEIFWGDARYAVGILSEPGADRAPRPPPPEVDFGRSSAITFATTIDLPFDGYQASEWPFGRDDDHDAYGRLRALLHGPNYLFGYPAHCSLAYDPTPQDHLPLLTLISDEGHAWCWHDGDCLMLFLDPTRVRRGPFPLAADAG